MLLGGSSCSITPLDVRVGSAAHSIFGIAGNVCTIEDGGLPSGPAGSYSNTLFLSRYDLSGNQLSFRTFSNPGANFGTARALSPADGGVWLAVEIKDTQFTWVTGSVCDAVTSQETHAVCVAHMFEDGTFDFQAKYQTQLSSGSTAFLHGATLAGQSAAVIGRGFGNGFHSSNLTFASGRWGPFILVAKLGGTGWLANFAGDDGEPQAITSDRGTGAIYVAGNSGVNGQPSSFFNIQGVSTTANNMDAGLNNRFVVRYTSDGGVAFAFGLATWSTGGAAAIAAEDGDVWIAAPFTGTISDLTSGVTGGLTSVGNVGTTDIALVKVSAANGIPSVGYRFGGIGNEQVVDLAFDGDGGLTLWGSTTNANWDAGWPGVNGGNFALTFSGRGIGLPLRATQFFPDAGAVVLRGGYDRLGLPVMGGALPSGASINPGSGQLATPGLFLQRQR